MNKILLITLFLIILESCNTFNLSLIGENLEYISDGQETIYLNGSGNGLIFSTNKVLRISNYLIKNDFKGKINDRKNRVEIVSYNVNEQGNGYLFFLEYDNKEKLSYKSILNYLEIKDLTFIPETKKEIDILLESDNIDFSRKIQSGIINKSEKYSGIYYLKQNKIIINIINNGKIENHEIGVNNKIKFNILELFIDENGNGWYLYEDNLSISKISLSNYIPQNEKVLSKSLNILVGNKFNVNGQGYLLFTSGEDFLIQKFNNFNNISELKLSLNKKDTEFLELNHDGNGIVFISEETPESKKSESQNSYMIPVKKDLFYRNYIKRVKNFIIENDRKLILDNSKFSFYKSFLNDSGNGLIFFSDNSNISDRNIIIKKIKNYSTSK